ncbi:MAG TPA: cytochrome c3 family protein [Bacteroidales bacterium]
MKNKVNCVFFLAFFLLGNIVQAQNDSLTGRISTSRTSFSQEDVRIGERIFYGLDPIGTKSINCASCHNVGPVDTMNWNPSAMDLAKKFANKDLAAFKAVLLQPTGKLMTQIHQGLEFNDDQIRQLKSYLTTLARQGEKAEKPVLTNRIIFLILLLLFILAFIDFAITHKIKFTIIHITVLFVTLILMTNYVVTSAKEIGRSKNYQPDQPIKFSHQIHAGQNQISCFYCHFNAEQSKFAGIPPASVCMNCHILIKEGTRSGKFEIDKIYQAIDENKPIKWVKVHNLPDYVFFSHAQHVVAGKLDCKLCHGNVASMDEIAQVNDLSMGWCIKCHRETGVQFDNKFYGKYAQLHKDLKDGKIKKVTVEQIGGTDCMKCHY